MISKNQLMRAARETGNAEVIQRAAAWYTILSRLNIGSFAELRMQFPNVDRVGERLVFDLGSYRLIAGFNFDSNRLYFKKLLTHSQYDRGGWKQ